MAALQKLKAIGATVILVTHKVNILSVVDKLLILHEGMVQAYARQRRDLAPRHRAESGQERPRAGIESRGPDQ